MTEIERGEFQSMFDNFPYRVIIVRWLFAGAEMALATYFVFNFKFPLGVFFLIYGLVCLFVLLPLIRCVRCRYYGKRCNFGWGVLVSRLFSRADTDDFSSSYGYTFLFWPLRILPIGLGMLKIPAGFTDGFKVMPHALFGIYLLLIILHRRYYRSAACQRCRQKEICPIYDIASMRGKIEN